jgi:hypothetical protein
MTFDMVRTPLLEMCATLARDGLGDVLSDKQHMLEFPGKLGLYAAPLYAPVF